MTLRRDLHEANRRSWNEATRAHESHKAGQGAWLRGGGSTLFPEELELLGDLAGKSLVHLSCNSGADTLSLAARGARVTGVDISDEAVTHARQLAADSGIAGEFERADVFDFLPAAAQAGRRWDVAFASYGALCWLSDLAAWARGVAGVLAPGGTLVIVEFHPIAGLHDEKLVRDRSYFSGGRVETYAPGVGDYVAASDAALVPWGFQEGVKDFANPHASHEFTWTIADVLGAILGAGLALEAFHEWPYSNGCKFFETMVPRPGQRWTLPDGAPDLPIMYGLRARRPR